MYIFKFFFFVLKVILFSYLKKLPIIIVSGSRKESKIGVSVNPDAFNLGKIHVTLIEAKDLVKSDMIGKSDPYAIISHGNQKFKTNTVHNSFGLIN